MSQRIEAALSSVGTLLIRTMQRIHDLRDDSPARISRALRPRISMRGRAVATPDAVRRVQVKGESKLVLLDPATIQDTQLWSVACQTIFGGVVID